MIRLNLGSGLQVAEGWVNIDRDDHGQGQLWDFRGGLPFDTASFDGVVAHHTLDMLTLDELGKLLADLHRVLREGGVLRISTPDPILGIEALARDDAEWFSMVALGTSLTEKLCHWLTWYGTRRTLLCEDMLRTLLTDAGFREVRHSSFLGTTPGWCGRWLGITELDSRPAESLFVEALA